MLFNSLRTSVMKHGSHLVFGEITYSQFFTKVLRYTYCLNSLGIKKSDRVLSISYNSPEMAALNFATQGLGAIFVPLFPKQNLEYYEQVYDDCKPKLFVVNSEKTNEDNIIGDFTFDNLESNTNELIPNDNCLSDDIATLLYTSGTSGKPKGVKLTHNNIYSNICGIPPMINPGDKTISFLPWSHSFGYTCELNYMIHCGGQMIINKNIKDIHSDFQTFQPDYLFSVPQLLTTIQQKCENLPLYKKMFLTKQHIFGQNLKAIAVAGASCPISTLKFIQNLGVSVYQGYGLTETSPLVTLNLNQSIPHSVGKSIKGVEVSLADDNEIIVSGSNVMKGYWGMPNIQQPFYTNDYGKFDENGNLYISGRKSDIFKLLNGKFVNPVPIETKIKENFPKVEQVCLIGENLKNTILLIYPKNSVSLEDIIKLTIFKEYEKPNKIVYLTKPFNIEDGTLTKKYSLRRSVIQKLNKE